MNDARSIYEKLLKLDTEKRLRTTFVPSPPSFMYLAIRAKFPSFYNTFDLFISIVEVRSIQANCQTASLVVYQEVHESKSRAAASSRRCEEVRGGTGCGRGSRAWLQPPRETQQALEQRRESKGELQAMPSLDSDGGTRRYEGLQGTRGFEEQVAPRYKWAGLVDAVREDISEIDD